MSNGSFRPISLELYHLAKRHTGQTVGHDRLPEAAEYLTEALAIAFSDLPLDAQNECVRKLTSGEAYRASHSRVPA